MDSITSNGSYLATHLATGRGDLVLSQCLASYCLLTSKHFCLGQPVVPQVGLFLKHYPQLVVRKLILGFQNEVTEFIRRRLSLVFVQTLSEDFSERSLNSYKPYESWIALRLIAAPPEHRYCRLDACILKPRLVHGFDNCYDFEVQKYPRCNAKP